MEADQQTMSKWLSDILKDIGIDEQMMCERRRTFSLKETMDNVASKLVVSDEPRSYYYVGSQIEGTTTMGLDSDCDILMVWNMVNIIPNSSDDNELDTGNILMIQDDMVTPGYCYLKYPQGPYIENTNLSNNGSLNFEQHGPAQTLSGVSGQSDYDIVHAYSIKSWPQQARQWLDIESKGKWPSKEIKRYCSQTNCLAVPVGFKGSKNERFEWRISTTLAERFLMFSLNVTQIKCYVLMKMILKTHLEESPFKDSISSYMCKTILFHRIANEDSDVWNDRNLFACLKLCLSKLYYCILNESCPHFIIRDNNLMAGRFTKELRHSLLEKVLWLSNHAYAALLKIKCDSFGKLLSKKSKNSYNSRSSRLCLRLAQINLIKDIIIHLSSDMSLLLYKIKSDRYNQVLCYLLLAKIHSDKQVCVKNELETFVYTLYIQQFSSIIGSTLASAGIQKDNKIPSSALKWIEWGLDTDVSSSRLKLASMYYCICAKRITEMVLKTIEDLYNQNKAYNICGCGLSSELYVSEEESVNNNIEAVLKYKTAFCVRFLPSESYCVPKELRYELFRSSFEDPDVRSEHDFWMDWAVVDSITYLYFLQYKTYGCLGKQEEKQKALNNLQQTIYTDVHLGHKETALNLLGQCLEQEGQPLDALRCYCSSLKVRRRNNGANIHICRLLSTMINECHCNIL